MPDSFEILYGLNPDSSSDRNTDLDDDGFTNYQEYVAGTDPSDEYSVPSSPSIVFHGVEGSVMTLEADATSEYGDIVSYDWDFGDGQTGIGSPVNHTYDSEGVYVVELTVTDELGISSTKSTIAQVSDSQPDAQFTVSSTSGTVPLNINFTDTSLSYDIIVSWDWDFGDGSPHSTEQHPNHTFSNPGTFEVTLSVTDADGSTDSMSLMIEATQTIAGDVDDDGDVDLTDAILVLRLLSGSSVTLNASADVNNNSKIDIAEEIYILQHIAEIRTQ